ncbi:hypothetical protein C2E23DRAFT_743270 [Lenzites betulinus]|nr:hypothetical protein C2E23DRAFT_743270 [Lenzites betulinus]
MSAQKLTKKQKKALAFRERKGKGKSNSFDDLDNDVPVDENQDRAEAEVDEEAGAVEAPAGRAPGAKKGAAPDAEALGDGGKGKKRKREEGPVDGDGEGAKETKPKKKRKGADGAGVAAGDAAEAEGEAKEDGKKVKQRYILFVGNLKYNTTKETVEKHFSKCDPPPSVRLMTPKPNPNNPRPTAKSKGFAFVEFSHRNALQQGLKLHQTDIDGRKINVELTAGGGGKSETRLEKVKKRNRDLHEQRQQQLSKQTPGKKVRGKSGDGGDGEVQMERPQRYSTTSGVEQMPSKKRTWTIPEGGEEGSASARKRGSKKGKSRPPKDFGTGVNAIPVG